MGGLSSLRPRIRSGGGNPDFGAIAGGGMKLSLRHLCGSLRSLREPDYFFFAPLRLCVNTNFFFRAKTRRREGNRVSYLELFWRSPSPFLRPHAAIRGRLLKNEVVKSMRSKRQKRVALLSSKALGIEQRQKMDVKCGPGASLERSLLRDICGGKELQNIGQPKRFQTIFVTTCLRVCRLVELLSSISSRLQHRILHYGTSTSKCRESTCSKNPHRQPPRHCERSDAIQFYA
jgi:hypothetical protein